MLPPCGNTSCLFTKRPALYVVSNKNVLVTLKFALVYLEIISVFSSTCHLSPLKRANLRRTAFQFTAHFSLYGTFLDIYVKRGFCQLQRKCTVQCSAVQCSIVQYQKFTWIPQPLHPTKLAIFSDLSSLLSSPQN
jgi:hypothetical protein